MFPGNRCMCLCMYAFWWSGNKWAVAMRLNEALAWTVRSFAFKYPPFLSLAGYRESSMSLETGHTLLVVAVVGVQTASYSVCFCGLGCRTRTWLYAMALGAWLVPTTSGALIEPPAHLPVVFTLCSVVEGWRCSSFLQRPHSHFLQRPLVTPHFCLVVFSVCTWV